MTFQKQSVTVLAQQSRYSKHEEQKETDEQYPSKQKGKGYYSSSSVE